MKSIVFLLGKCILSIVFVSFFILCVSLIVYSSFRYKLQAYIYIYIYIYIYTYIYYIYIYMYI